MPADEQDLIKAELALSSPSLYLKHDLDAVLELQVGLAHSMYLNYNRRLHLELLLCSANI